MIDSLISLISGQWITTHVLFYYILSDQNITWVIHSLLGMVGINLAYWNKIRCMYIEKHVVLDFKINYDNVSSRGNFDIVHKNKWIDLHNCLHSQSVKIKGWEFSSLFLDEISNNAAIKSGYIGQFNKLIRDVVILRSFMLTVSFGNYAFIYHTYLCNIAISLRCDFMYYYFSWKTKTACFIACTKFH